MLAITNLDAFMIMYEKIWMIRSLNILYSKTSVEKSVENTVLLLGIVFGSFTVKVCVNLWNNVGGHSVSLEHRHCNVH